MLGLELAEFGIETVTELKLTYIEDKFYVIADLDSCSTEELVQLPKNVTLIGYTRQDPSEMHKKTQLCSSTLHRPFRTVELIELLGEESSYRSRAQNAKKAEKIQDNKVLTVSSGDKSAIWGDVKIALSDNEYKLLSVLCRNRGEAVSRETICSLLGVTDGNMGDVYICHLRRKIDNKLGLKLIYTIRGKGYMLKN
jgi:DNA-binding response OmpR family regulator